MADKDNKKKKNGLGKRLGKYFRDTWGEFKKIAWPSRKQIINNTIVVAVTVVVVGVVVLGLDLLFGGVRDLILLAFN